MTTKAYLSQIERLDRMIQNKLSEIYQLKTMACSVTVSNDGERIQKSGDKDKLGSTVSKIVDLERETDDLIDKFVEKRKHIVKQIDDMEDIDYYHILSMRYVSRNTFEDISEKTYQTLDSLITTDKTSWRKKGNIYLFSVMWGNGMPTPEGENDEEDRTFSIAIENGNNKATINSGMW